MITENIKTASLLLRAYYDFLTSREAMRCTPKTMAHYRYSAGQFADWLWDEGIQSPADITGSHVRQYLSNVRDRGVQDTTLHVHARGIKTLLRFFHAEGYMLAPVSITMPRLDRKRLPYLEADDLQRLVDACPAPRDRALVMLMADSGLRLAETCALLWGDIDVKSGLVEVRRGKGGKARTAVVGEFTRRAMLDYRRWWVQTHGGMPTATNALWPNFRTGEALTGSGISLLIRRHAKAAGVKASPHMLRRSFATLSVRAGMSAFHLQALLGHSTPEMTNRYVQLVDADLRQAHQQFGPLDRWLATGRRRA